MTIYTANLSLALILLAIFKANSIGIRLSAPAHAVKTNKLRVVGSKERGKDAAEVYGTTCHHTIIY